MIYFSTRLFESDQRHDAWGKILAQYCGPFELRAQHALDAQMEREMIAGLPCVRIAQNSQYMRRTRKELENTHQEFYYVMLQMGGQSRISQCGTEASMTPGSVVVLDSGRPLSMDYSGKNVHLCFHIPRSSLEPSNGRAPRIGQVLTGASALLVGSLMQTAFTNARAFDDGQGQALQDSLISLISSAFTAADLPRDTSGICDTPAKLRFIHAYIGRNLDSDKLSPLTIARACGLSVRHLHRLFNESDTSLTRWVRRRRLDRCAADLRNAAMRNESITAIAFRWGFNDTAHFSRSFKAEFGQNARDYRAAALSAVTHQRKSSMAGVG